MENRKSHICSEDELNSISLPVLNHLESKLTEHADRLESVVLKHTEEEMGRYSSILKTLEDHVKNSESRHNLLKEEVQANSRRMDKFHGSVSLAFNKDEEGNPDFKGHGKVHLVWENNKEKERALLSYVEKQMEKDKERNGDLVHIKRGVFTAVLVVIVLWIGSTLLQEVITRAVTKAPTSVSSNETGNNIQSR